MKKYKVITDNLDWIEMYRGGKVEEDKATFTSVNGITYNVVRMHPDWFQEINDSPREYTKGDLISYGNYIQNANMENFIDTDNDPFEWWLKYRKA